MISEPNPDVPVRPTSQPAITELARVVEDRLHQSLDTFTLDGARLYGVTVVDAGVIDGEANGADDSFRLCFLAQHPDVYELLASSSSSLGRMFDAAALITSGWAAPLGPTGRPEGPPSEHAMRRRVRLAVVVSDVGVASVVRFADEPDDVIVDAGSATGSLAEAIDTYWFNPPAVAESA
jgi:hypothetical protein